MIGLGKKRHKPQLYPFDPQKVISGKTVGVQKMLTDFKTQLQ